MNKSIFNYQAAIWDIYGTILIKDKSKIIDSTDNTFLNALDILLKKNFSIEINSSTLHSIKTLYYKFIEDNKTQNKLKGIDYPEIVIENIWRLIFNNIFNKRIPLNKLKSFAYDFENSINPVKLAPDVDKLLLKFKELNIINGFLSNCQFYTKIILENELQKINPNYSVDYFFNKYFSLFSYKTGYCKPSLFLFDKMKQKLKKKNIKPYKTLYIGNTIIKDVVPASTFKFKPVLITLEESDKINNKKKLELIKNYDIMHFKNYKMFVEKVFYD